MYVKGTFGKLQVILGNLTFDAQQSCAILAFAIKKNMQRYM